MLPDHVVAAQQLGKVSWASASSSLVLIARLFQNLSALSQIPPSLSKLFTCGRADTNGKGCTWRMTWWQQNYLTLGYFIPKCNLNNKGVLIGCVGVGGSGCLGCVVGQLYPELFKQESGCYSWFELLGECLWATLAVLNANRGLIKVVLCSKLYFYSCVLWSLQATRAPAC